MKTTLTVLEWGVEVGEGVRRNILNIRQKEIRKKA